MNFKEKPVHIVGAGLAGSEAAFQLAEHGIFVILHEMRHENGVSTPAHKTHDPAELVCSNSFGSETDYSPGGQLKWEAEQRNSMILKCAQSAQVPAGMSLSVDRVQFSKLVKEKLYNHPNIEISHKVISNLDDIPRPAIIATGPLTHQDLAKSLSKHFGNDFLYFYDAIAPIIDADSINYDKVWFGDRFDKGNKDYINCPLTKEEYFAFIEEVKGARKTEPKEFEKDIPYFDGCMPIEEIVSRGDLTLKHGPLSPRGLNEQGPLKDEDRGYFAVAQLRKENVEATAYNMVGFQTKMTYGEQKRVFKLIPGLEEAEFLKLGSIHKNLYINSPKMLTEKLSSKNDTDLYFAGQITGVEGYFESTCIGLLVADFLIQQYDGKEVVPPHRNTAFGSLYNAIREEKANFQPTNINFSLFPLPDEKLRGRKNKIKKREIQIQRARALY